ncbi:MAG: hypothetical protein L0241_12365 [Planctomycetia bacterium]|nr:hypothetical protein [Planctomycetia bacterium]
MRRLSIPTLLALPLLLFATPNPTSANDSCSYGFGCGGYCFKLFSGIHQHGPLFNYGPYYGYYPFKPYGPWDEYLRYDPFFYGDPYAGWNGGGDGWYGRNPHLPSFNRSHLGLHHLRPSQGGGLFNHGCKNCGFWHASWLQGGWFRGHNWIHGGHQKLGCKSCGGVAQVAPVEQNGDAVTRLNGTGTSAQSSVFYADTPTLNPAIDVQLTSGFGK